MLDEEGLQAMEAVLGELEATKRRESVCNDELRTARAQLHGVDCVGWRRALVEQRCERLQRRAEAAREQRQAVVPRVRAVWESLERLSHLNE